LRLSGKVDESLAPASVPRHKKRVAQGKGGDSERAGSLQGSPPPDARPVKPGARLVSFDELARGSDDAIDVGIGAALIAKDVYPNLDVAALVRRLEDLAGPLNNGALAGVAPAAQAERVSARFRELGFRGNTDDYYDARNSLLPDVLDRRM